MQELPLLSVVIVAYKSRDEIAACLASIPHHIDGGVVETVVVDNAAGDGTREIIRRDFSHVTYIDPGSNLGFGRANNLGYARTHGAFVLFLNPDTVSNPAALTHCIRRLEAEADIGLISPKLVQGDGAMDLACRRSIPSLWSGFCRASGLAAAFPRIGLFSGYNLTHRPDDGTYNVGAINGAFMLAPRAALKAVAQDGRVFDEAFFMYGDDLDLCIRVAKTRRRIVYDGRASIVHLKGTSVAKDFDAMSTAIFDANRDVYLKHFGTNPLARVTYRLMFGLWKRVALARARVRGHRQVRPV